MMKQQFLKHCKEQGYFQNHKKVLLAISGGLDSMTLLNLLYESQSELHIELVLAHVNHKQRLESEYEEKELKKKPFLISKFSLLFELFLKMKNN